MARAQHSLPDEIAQHLEESGIYLGKLGGARALGLVWEEQEGGRQGLLKFLYPHRKVRGGQFWRGRIFVRGDGDAWTPKTGKTRYLQPEKSGAWMYFPALWDWDEVRADTTYDVWITEGEKKAIKACAEGLVCLSVPGVPSWHPPGGYNLHRELEEFQWRGRRVILAFDADQLYKPQVREGVEDLGLRLMRAGAQVVSINLEPLGGRDAKLDDVLVGSGVEEVLGLVKVARPPVHPAVLEIDEEAVHIREAGSVWLRRLRKEVPLSVGRTSLFVDRTSVTRAQNGGAFDTWLRWPGHSAKDALDLFVGENEEVERGGISYFNLWEGWACKPQRGSCGAWRKLVANVAGSPEAALWLEQWLAYRIQTGERPLTAVLLLGTQGTGKSLFCRTVGHGLYGEHLSVELGATSIEKDQGRNAWCAGKAWAFVSDTEGGSSTRRFNVGGLLKSVVTDSHLWEDRKYLQPRQRRNAVQLVVCTNHWDEIQIEDADRRWSVLRSTTPLDSELYKHLPAELSAVLHRLMHVDLAGFDPVKPFGTETKQQVVHATSKAERQYLVMLRDGELDAIDMPPWRIIRPSELFDACAQWRKRHGLRAYHQQPQQLMAEVLGVFGEERVVELSTRQLNGSRKPRRYVLLQEEDQGLNPAALVARRAAEEATLSRVGGILEEDPLDPSCHPRSPSGGKVIRIKEGKATGGARRTRRPRPDVSPDQED
jgi:hypothetical protein